jgi:hypothetical protein
MKHNIWMASLLLNVLLGLMSLPSYGKIIQSEFFNQAEVGREGPEISAIKVSNNMTYLLTYYIPGKEPYFRTISDKSYRKIQAEMRNHLKLTRYGNSTTGYCEREIVYTKVIDENKVSNSILCWAKLGSKNRLAVSDWLIRVQKSLH